MPDKFWINSLGEFGNGDKLLGGSVNIADLSNLNREEQDAVAAVRHRKQVEEATSAQEAKLYWRWEELMSRFGSDRWRFNAGIGEPHGEVILLSTEFQHDSKDEAFWTGLRALARDFGAEVETMWDHDDEGLQVSVEWDVIDKTNDEIEALIHSFAERTETLWTQSGVSVI